MSFTACLGTGVQCRAEHYVWLCPLCSSHVSFFPRTAPTVLFLASFPVEFLSLGFVRWLLWYCPSCSSVLLINWKLYLKSPRIQSEHSGPEYTTGILYILATSHQKTQLIGPPSLIRMMSGQADGSLLLSLSSYVFSLWPEGNLSVVNSVLLTIHLMVCHQLIILTWINKAISSMVTEVAFFCKIALFFYHWAS